MTVIEMSAVEFIGVTTLCKEPNCPDDAIDKTGRFAGLCEFHKREAITAAKRKGFAVGSHGPRVPAEPVKLAHELSAATVRLVRAERSLARGSTPLREERVEQRRAELRVAYLKLGLITGLIKAPSRC